MIWSVVARLVFYAAVFVTHVVTGLQARYRIARLILLAWTVVNLWIIWTLWERLA